MSKVSESIWTRSFIGIFFTQLFIFIVFYALLTTLPLYVIDELGRSESSAGLVVTVMLIAAILIRPISPKILDLFGKKRTLMFNVILFAGTTALYFFMTELGPLLVVRFIHGISFGILTTVTGSIAADIIPEKRRGAGMGYFAMAMNLALVIGPFLGLLLVQKLTFNWMFLVLTVLMVLSVIFSLMITLKEAPRAEKFSFALKPHDLIEVRAIPAGIVIGLVGFSYASILSFVPVYAEELNIAAVASYFFIVYAFFMISSRPSLGRLMDEKGAPIVLIPSLIIFGLGLWTLSATTTAFIFLVAAGLIGLGYGSLMPGFQTLSIQSTTPARSSHAISTFFIFYDIGMASGAYVWGVLVATEGFPVMYQFAGTLMFLAMIVYVFIIRWRRVRMQ